MNFWNGNILNWNFFQYYIILIYLIENNCWVLHVSYIFYIEAFPSLTFFFFSDKNWGKLRELLLFLWQICICELEMDFLGQSNIVCLWRGSVTLSVFFLLLPSIIVCCPSAYTFLLYLPSHYSVIRDWYAPLPPLLSIEILSYQIHIFLSVPSKTRCHLRLNFHGKLQILKFIL